MPYTTITPDHITALSQIVGETNLSITPADRDQHSHDESDHTPHLPDVVVWPTSAQQVADVLHYANQQRIPVTPWGVGTSLEGNPIPVYGGILLSSERLNQIIEVHPDDFQVTVQSGVCHEDLNAQLTRHGLFYPPDPGANATVGGMLANNASGIRTVKYGASKDNVLRMQVALADGRLINVGSRSVKQSSGYDLLHLFVGSEGTLGIITEATLRLVPIPTHISTVIAAFQSVETAVETVVAVRGSGLEPAALEFIDAEHCRMLSSADGVDLEEHPTLFMEFHAAHEMALTSGVDLVCEICQEMEAISIHATTDNAERHKLWYARHHAHEILKRSYPDKQFRIMDVAVPISAYPALIGFIEHLKQKQGIIAYMIGHAGDGNIHVVLPYIDQIEYKAVIECDHLIVRKALALGGTATGEHGVGIGKVMFMEHEHGAALDVMRMIKQTLDPNAVLNPGKIFPS